MKIHSTIRLMASIGLLVAAGNAMSDDVQLTLTGGEEVPPVMTQARGSGLITVNPDMTVSGAVSTTGIAATMAHIHVGKPGVNGPAVVTLTKTGDNAWAVPPGARLSEEQYRAYTVGELYVNVHSAEHKGGEIRGQLVPPVAASMPRRFGGY